LIKVVLCQLFPGSVYFFWQDWYTYGKQDGFQKMLNSWSWL